MTKSILAVNAGSSSVKITFYTFEDHPRAIVNAQISGITAPPPMLQYRRGTTKHKEKLKETLITPQDAFKYLLQRCFDDPELSEVASKDDLTYICHRVVHGGDYCEVTEINGETYHRLEELESLAPLHNFSALEIIRLCRIELPNVKSVASFDTAFHKTLPEYMRTYPINQEVAKAQKLRKYGFHGISYSFILRSVADFLGKPAERTNLIAMHLGSGASICAIEKGKSIDTSMGLTPLAGLPGATRSGDIDPTLIFHCNFEAVELSSASNKEMHISTAEDILNNKSGWKGLTGTSDFAKIAVADPPSEAHKLAFDIFVDRLLGYIGNYYVKLEGKVDALVFAGGIGENNAILRKQLIEKCQSLGVEINSVANNGELENSETVKDISKTVNKKPRVLICQTDEQLEMAYHFVNPANS
ncbi:hypothetical protein N7510_011858 [Penicillium lagena]|uniref:uncharacterized protein n=1 Tax=Penicillium lagena TaxID=94218 RepID=UPI00253FFDAE|nr:uncharacterized protein N7510_011858 [Penicillium lagena]KAJ5598908.1 hypothetical protein N7510_011858 [Penicillium lagena]